MKITKRQLKRIIREEYSRVLKELNMPSLGQMSGIHQDEVADMAGFVESLIDSSNPEADEMLDYVDSEGIFGGGLYFLRKLKERYPGYADEDYRAAMQQYNTSQGSDRLIDDSYPQY